MSPWFVGLQPAADGCAFGAWGDPPRPSRLQFRQCLRPATVPLVRSVPAHPPRPPSRHCSPPRLTQAREVGAAGYVGKRLPKCLVRITRTCIFRRSKEKCLAGAVEDRVSLVAQVQTHFHVTKKEALQIVAHVQLFGREAVRDAARAGELDADRLTVLNETLAQVPVLDRDEVEAELLAALLSPLAKPTADDRRTTPQRQGDAFVDIVELAAGSEKLPVEGGERPHLTVTMSVREVMSLVSAGRLEGGEPIDSVSGRADRL
ncbi:DUF222 domain-containing protein [Kutzneria buriramensis]